MIHPHVSQYIVCITYYRHTLHEKGKNIQIFCLFGIRNGNVIFCLKFGSYSVRVRLLQNYDIFYSNNLGYFSLSTQLELKLAVHELKAHIRPVRRDGLRRLRPRCQGRQARTRRLPRRRQEALRRPGPLPRSRGRRQRRRGRGSGRNAGTRKFSTRYPIWNSSATKFPGRSCVILAR